MSSIENQRAKKINEKLILIPATEAVDTATPTPAATPLMSENVEVADLAEIAATRANKRYEKTPKLSNAELQVAFNSLVHVFFQERPYEQSPQETPELEVKFGTKGIKPITKNDYDNVIKKLKTLGFTPITDSGEHLLRMQNRALDRASGRFKKSNVRVEIVGLHSIQNYCNNNRINDVDFAVNMHYKQDVRATGDYPRGTIVNNGYFQSVDFDHFNFRLSYKKEKRVSNNGHIGMDIMSSWDNSKKEFRYINRVTFVHALFPFKIDLSIVKSSAWDFKTGPVLSTSFQSSGVISNPEHYEIEIEVDNKKLGDPSFLAKDGVPLLLSMLRKVIKYVLCGLQETNFPIAYTEQQSVLDQYIMMLHKAPLERRINSRDFIGYQSHTLQVKNIVPPNKNSNDYNIHSGYVVTEKADGDRTLMFIAANGKIYLINSSMKVIFTGTITEKKELFNTLLDGELIVHNKYNNYINLYAAFDIYYLNGDDIRKHYFMPSQEKEKDDPLKSRHYWLNQVIDNLELKSVVESDIATPIRIICKQFYPKKYTETIFQACNTILTNIAEGIFEYNTDGLIFTPISFGVGGYERGAVSAPERTSWEASFKWKPPRFNTIDFLVTTKKNSAGQDLLTSMFEEGVNAGVGSQNKRYKTLILECGIDEKRDIYLNPCQDIIDDILPSFKADGKLTYKHMQFYPTTPFDEEAGICNIMVTRDETGADQMFTLEGDVINNNTIVEFSYDLTDPSKPKHWRWSPLRVRYDKTGELRNGQKTYGNDYRTANSNWSSIHNPVTEEMLMYGVNIPEIMYDDDIYYNEQSSNATTTTRGLRDFHNLFVKKSLIRAVSKPGDTLIDFACGKAGDMSKWIAAGLSFVFGIDVSKDNLENRINGACSRYLNSRKQFKQMPYALFVNGDSSKNIRTGNAIMNEKSAEVTRAIFGQGTKSVERLGKGVVRQFSRGADGFNIGSCQFALHYFCETPTTFYNFIRNVAECTKIGGYFIGTCYDGLTIFKRLKSTATNDSVVINMPGSANKKVWEVVKEYSAETLENDTSCLGMKINVFQETIGKLTPEYLVNFRFFTQTMEDYGFKLVSRNEARQQLGMPDGTGLFVDLFDDMAEEAARDEAKAIEYKNALNMAPYEKTISFLNRYFIYKKSNHIDAEKLTNALLKKNAQEYVNEMGNDDASSVQRDETKEDAGVIVEAEKPLKIPAKPRTKKLVTKLRITDLDVAEEAAPAPPVAAAVAPVAPAVAPPVAPPVAATVALDAPVVEIEATVIEEPVIKIKVKKPRATKK
jgi:hypothetical protein